MGGHQCPHLRTGVGFCGFKVKILLLQNFQIVKDLSFPKMVGKNTSKLSVGSQAGVSHQIQGGGGGAGGGAGTGLGDSASAFLFFSPPHIHTQPVSSLASTPCLYLHSQVQIMLLLLDIFFPLRVRIRKAMVFPV